MPEANLTIQWHRRLMDQLATTLAIICVLLVIIPLAAIFIYLVIRGVASLNVAFFTHIPSGSPGEPGGGMANAIVGSAIVLLTGSLIGVPLGVGSGIYLSEYSRGQFGRVVRFTADVLNGVPSIVIGIAVYALLVIRQKHFSALAGGVALGIMMIPIITRSTEEMLRLVPNSIREAALGLGIPQWRSTLSITLRTAISGVITGVMLAFARVSGETAPLLFTVLGNQFWSTKLNQPIAALPLQIYVYALSPYDEWHRLAWGGALVLIVLIVATSASVRWIASRGFAGSAR
ncbi:MAG: phosphate ABC transporter permease PtsA [Acidobacteria bacterium]|nr:MAG: phosphate ABC transporter permease PtsA [Acidobacteriota bacterium]PYY21672.1 MAG: phosphate ABC transporter permease PtsA [Acidobacteriota bacterium]